MGDRGRGGGGEEVRRKKVVKRYYQVVEEARNTRGIRKRQPKQLGNEKRVWC